MTSEDGWELVESVAEYETGWYTAGYSLMVQPDGTEKKYYWCELPPAAVVVAVDDGEVVVVEQYRPTIDEKHVELPAGIVEDGESFEEAGRRELEEETGHTAEETRLLQEFWVATGVLRHRRGIVFATELGDGEREFDSDEFLETRRIDAEEALEVARQPPANGSTVEGLLIAKEEGLI